MLYIGYLNNSPSSKKLQLVAYREFWYLGNLVLVFHLSAVQQNMTKAQKGTLIRSS